MMLIVASDSTAGISIASRLGLAKVKHVEIRRLFVQDLVKKGRLKLEKYLAY